MATDKPARSAEEIYQDARTRMAEAVRLSVYDDKGIIRTIAGLLEEARRRDPRHVKSLVLLSDILMELGATQEAMEIIQTLIKLEPNNPTHAKKKALVESLEKSGSADDRDAVRDFVEDRWTTTKDW